jgi:hypothetical protein
MEEKVVKVGDMVWFWPADNDEQARSNGNFTNPVAAVVTRVWGGEMVNLTVFPDNGQPIMRSSVHKGPKGDIGYSWEFPW